MSMLDLKTIKENLKTNKRVKIQSVNYVNVQCHTRVIY